MFDHYNLGSGPSSVHVTKHEHRAPTDASVRLLAEMEAKARERVLASVPLECNDFNGVLHHMRSPLQQTDEFVIQYELNGSRYEVPVSVRRGVEAMLNPKTYALLEVRDALAKHIASTALRNMSWPKL